VRSLERRWEEALEELRELQEDYARFRQQQPAKLSEHEVAQIGTLEKAPGPG
jgi:hypothetical protein